jgi:hypothetical protein
MKQISIIAFLFLTLHLSYSQEIDVKKDCFKGVKKIICYGYGSLEYHHHKDIYYPGKYSGFKAIYILNDSGKAVIEKRYRNRKLLEINNYTYYDNNLLKQRIIKYDLNNKKDTNKLICQYLYTLNDKNQIMEESSFYNTSFIYDSLGNIAEEDCSFYRDGIVHTVSKQIYHYDGKVLKQEDYFDDSVSYKCTYQFDKYGNLLKFDLFDRSDSVKYPDMKKYYVDFLGDGEHYCNFYIYDKKGRWIKEFRVINNKNILIEERKYYDK